MWSCVRIGVLAAVLLGLVAFFNQNRSRNPNFPIEGVPRMLIVVVVLLIVWTFILSRTRYGRHIYAVGGNAEAARRAGINVTRIRTSVFVACTTMAVVSGILLAANTGKISPGSGGSNTLLYAVGAAVIGGTSLFGGKGRAIDAIIGGLVIATDPQRTRPAQPGSLDQLRRDRWRPPPRRERRRDLASPSFRGRGLAGSAGSSMSTDRRAGTGTNQEAVRRHNLGTLLRHVHRAGQVLAGRAHQRDGAQPQHHRGPGRRARVARA